MWRLCAKLLTPKMYTQTIIHIYVPNTQLRIAKVGCKTKQKGFGAQGIFARSRKGYLKFMGTLFFLAGYFGHCVLACYTLVFVLVEIDVFLSEVLISSLCHFFVVVAFLRICDLCQRENKYIYASSESQSAQPQKISRKHIMHTELLLRQGAMSNEKS